MRTASDVCTFIVRYCSAVINVVAQSKMVILYRLCGANTCYTRKEAHVWHSQLVMADMHPRSQPRVSERYTCEHVPGTVLQNRAAHVAKLVFVRQIARKPQPPVTLRVLQFN